MAQGRIRRTGELLIEKGLISQQQLDQALKMQDTSLKKIGDILIDLGFVTEKQVLDVLSKQYNLPMIDLSDAAIQPEATALINVNLARKYTLLPIRKENSSLIIAMADPLDFYAIDDVRTVTGLMVKPVIALKEQILEAIEKSFQGDAAKAVAREIKTERKPGANEETELLLEEIKKAPVVRLVQSILQYAIRKNASDIHIEPMEDEMRVRIRQDGELQEAMRTPVSAHSAVVTRIKIMAHLDIAEKRLPQDGRIEEMIDGKSVDMRISIMPTVFGEKIVIRLLNKSDMILTKEDLGLANDNAEIFQKIIKSPNGMVLVTGPTGSGKTTTLYAVLKELNNPALNILTIEDPVEYQMEGVNHTQVNTKAGMTFASGLRAILRQDPDIIMVGEIRDSETAQIAIRAAITGHLVLSTVHTNDSASTISRLVDMGIEPFLLSSSLVGIVAQRLVKRLCPKCREPYTASKSEMNYLGLEQGKTIYRRKGCSHCNFAGYKGRTAIFEIMAIDRRIRELIDSRATADEIRDAAVQAGMTNLRQNCTRLVLDGVTSMDELMRATYQVD